MKSDYTIIGAVEKQRTNKTAVVAVAGFFVLAAVLALASVSGVSQGELRVSSNVQTLSSELKLEFQKVCDSPDTRYVIAVFDGTEIVPCVEGPATDHWESDYAHFEEAITRCVGLSKYAIAFAVYNMPVWETEDHHSYTNYPTFIDYVAPGVDMADIYWAGTYLGATKLAASCVTASVKITDLDGEGSRMVGTCEKISKDESMIKRCESMQTVACPYEGETNPCEEKVCKADILDETFASAGSIGDQCCAAIKAWCVKSVDEKTKPGCGKFAHKQIYTEHCDAGYAAIEKPELILHPFLVAQEAAAAQAIIDAEVAAQKVLDDIAAEKKAAEDKLAADLKAAEELQEKIDADKAAAAAIVEAPAAPAAEATGR